MTPEKSRIRRPSTLTRHHPEPQPSFCFAPKENCFWRRRGTGSAAVSREPKKRDAELPKNYRQRERIQPSDDGDSGYCTITGLACIAEPTCSSASALMASSKF